MFAKAFSLSLSWARLIQFMTSHSYSFSSRSTAILFSCLYLGLPNGLFPSFSPPKSVCFPFTPYLLHAPPISFLIWSPKWFDEQQKPWISFLCNFLQSPVTVPFEVHIVVKQIWILLIFHLSPARFICYRLFTVWTREHPISIYDCRCYWRKDSDLDSASTNIWDLHNAVTCGSAVSGSTDVQWTQTWHAAVLRHGWLPMSSIQEPIWLLLWVMFEVILFVSISLSVT